MSPLYQPCARPWDHRQPGADLGLTWSAASLTQGQGALEVSERWASVGWSPDIPKQGQGPHSSICAWMLHRGFLDEDVSCQPHTARIIRVGCGEERER